MKVFLTIVLFCHTFLAISQVQFPPENAPKSDTSDLTKFQRCNCKVLADETSATIERPASILTGGNGDIREFRSSVPYEVHYSPWSNLYDGHIVAEGMARSFEMEIETPEPGLYTINFFHEWKPAVMRIFITPYDIHQGGYLIRFVFFVQCDRELFFAD